MISREIISSIQRMRVLCLLESQYPVSSSSFDPYKCPYFHRNIRSHCGFPNWIWLYSYGLRSVPILFGSTNRTRLIRNSPLIIVRVRGLGIDHRFYLHFSGTIKSQTRSKWAMFQPNSLLNRPQPLTTAGGVNSTSTKQNLYTFVCHYYKQQKLYVGIFHVFWWVFLCVCVCVLLLLLLILFCFVVVVFWGVALIDSSC